MEGLTGVFNIVASNAEQRRRFYPIRYVQSSLYLLLSGAQELERMESSRLWGRHAGNGMIIDTAVNI